MSIVEEGCKICSGYLVHIDQPRRRNALEDGNMYIKHGEKTISDMLALFILGISIFYWDRKHCESLILTECLKESVEHSVSWKGKHFLRKLESTLNFVGPKG